MTCGRREERKAQTRQALITAALELLAEDGIESVTAERVSERAGVSRRTLFNYFARVEDLVTENVRELTDHMVDLFTNRPSDEPLRESVVAVLLDFTSLDVLRQGRTLTLAAAESPATRHYLREFTQTQAEAFERGLQTRIGPDADPIYVGSLAASVAAVLDRVMRMWPELDPGPDPDLSAQYRRIVEAIGLIFAGFDEDLARSASTPATV